ncbi:CRISPR-associated protein Csn2-St [Companilactobacillus halodurans]|uniref:CRISPR-associated protein Cas7 n=1 Tax=Companilactobacillus halodurans TaxID=2584183 RepID=A0A5P0ZNG4_9LACO|nr:CRISPR-associated protein Csn2-St [Companilactobacillus halodurans]MQS75773.1 hypothetical protein [Companilactobacillus halodurans]MQS98615.1 hypothetical protein [Companilactobacillus halodurans]
MTLKIEIENQKFLEIDFEDAAYITGPNRKQIWEIYRSLYYYFHKNPQLTTNIYGEDEIEILYNDDKLSVRNNNVYFINSRNDIYTQMTYKKGTLLFELLNSLSDDNEIDHEIEQLNNETLKLEIIVQKLLKTYSNNLRAEFEDTSYLELLKNRLIVGYESDGINYPLEFLDTGVLLDEFVNFLEFQLKSLSKTSWVILYDISGFVAPEDEANFILSLKKLTLNYDLKIIYLGNNLENVPLTSGDLEKIIISADEFHQLLPSDELKKSVSMHYPNKYVVTEMNFVNSIRRISQYIGNDEINFIPSKDLVLLKVVNEILGYETSLDPEKYLLSDAETKFLEN